MSLRDTLEAATQNCTAMIKSIAISQFGSDRPEDRQITRRWRFVDAAKMVGVSMTAITKAEETGRLPPPDMTTTKNDVVRRAGYTLQQIHQMMDIFGTRPTKGAGDAAVISICGHKGGSWKTSTSVYMAQWAAMQGYKVLLIDTDPQATASAYHGYIYGLNTSDQDTALPFMMGEQGELDYAIKDTSIPGLDIIPSGLGMQKIETDLDSAQENGLIEHPAHMMLRAGIETVMDDYDLIIVDGSPNLGEGTVNQICAADVIICPTPAEMGDYMSTAQFFDGLNALLSNIDLDGFEPDLRVLITKYQSHPESAANWMAQQIRAQWGELVLEHPVAITEEVGKGQIRMMTIYQQDKDQRSSAKAWRRAQDIWEPVFTEIMHKCVKPRWEAQQ